MWGWCYFSYGILTKKIEINQFTKNSSFKVSENLLATLYNKNASLDFFHPMVFLIDEKLGNLALFDEISLLGITVKQKPQCTPLLQSNLFFTFMTLRSIFCHMIYKGRCALCWWSIIGTGTKRNKCNFCLWVPATDLQACTIHVPRPN